ncbi:MAG: hypothetical protein ABI553_04645 [Chloroflexota bacterium]
MRPLERLRLRVVVGERVVLALARERAIREETLEHGHRLLEPPRSLFTTKVPIRSVSVAAAITPIATTGESCSIR